MTAVGGYMAPRAGARKATSMRDIVHHGDKQGIAPEGGGATDRRHLQMEWSLPRGSSSSRRLAITN